MRREQRLRSRKDFSAVYRQGRMYGNHLLVVRVRKNDLGVARFGFAVGKAVGGAVVRNRVKRRLREIARALPVRAGVDVVIGARKPASQADFAALRSGLISLAARARVLERVAPAGEESP